MSRVGSVTGYSEEVLIEEPSPDYRGMRYLEMERILHMPRRSIEQRELQQEGIRALRRLGIKRYNKRRYPSWQHSHLIIVGVGLSLNSHKYGTFLAAGMAMRGQHVDESGMVIVANIVPEGQPVARVLHTGHANYNVHMISAPSTVLLELLGQLEFEALQFSSLIGPVDPQQHILSSRVPKRECFNIIFHNLLEWPKCR